LAEFGKFMHHAGEEFLYVLQGELELHTESYAPLILKAGESTYFDSRMGHAYVVRGEGPCRGLVICTVPRADERGLSAEAGNLQSHPADDESAATPNRRIVKTAKRRSKRP
jgi:uncharacterized cupin superfamily protein